MQALLSQSHHRQFQVEWLAIDQVDSSDELMKYDVFLGDAPLKYLLDHLDFFQNKFCCWLTESEITQAELFRQPITDCFLWSEFSLDLFSHCLRRHRLTQAAPAADPLAEFQGDRFQTLIKNIPGAVYRCLHNKDWQGVYISDAIADIVGYPATDFFPTGNRTFASLIHPEDVTLVEENIDEHLEKKEPFALEYRLIDRDGVTHWVDERGQGIFDKAGDLLWIDGVIVDITAQKKYLTHIAQQQRNYYEKTPAMLYAVNQTGDIVAVSDRWLEVMGYTREAVIGRKLTEFLTLQSQEFAKQMLPLFYQQGQISDVEYQFVKKDGEIIDISLSGTIDNSGVEQLALAVLVDVTARNRLATQLNTYQAHLQDLVRQRTNALAMSETRLRSILNCAPIGIAETDLTGQFRFINQRGAEMFGMEVITLLSRSVFDVTYDQDHTISAEIFAKFRNQEIDTFSCEKRYLRSDGSWFWGSLHIASVKNFQGEVAYLVATIEDIHARKSAAEALRTSEYRLAAAQKIARLGVWEWDFVSQAVYWSPACFEIFGYEANSIEPTAALFLNAIHPDDRSRVNVVIENILSGGKYNDDEIYRIITPAGETKFLKDCIEIVRDGSGTILLLRGAAQDITAEMSTITALEKSDARLALAQAIAQVRVWEWDIVNDEYYWSENSYEIFGLEPQSLEANFENFFALVHKDDRPLLLERVDQILNGDLSAGETEYRTVTPAGEVKFVRDRFTVERDESGAPVFIQGICQDITKYKEIIAALEKSEARLARAQAIANIGVWEWNITDKKIFWSPECFEISSYEPNSFEPTVAIATELLHPDDRLRIQTLTKNIFTGKLQKDNLTEQVRIITPTGKTKTLNNYIEISRTDRGKVLSIRGAVQDVTAETTTLKALEQSELRLAEAQKIAKLGYWESYFSVEKLYWSEVTYGIFDVDPTSFQPTYQRFLSFVHPDDLPIIEQAVDELLRGDRNVLKPIEFRITTSGNTQKILRAYINLLKDEVGEVIGLRGTNQDITEDQQTMAALAASEARLAKAQKIAKIGVWEWELASDTLTWSRELFQLFDLEPQSLNPDFDVFLSMVEPGDRPRILEALERLKAGQKVYDFEYKINTSRTQKIVVEHVDAITDEAGIVTHFSGTLQDVTAFRQASLALQESETRFRELVENIDECFWVSPPDPTKITYISPAYERIWGRSCQSLIDDSLSWLEAVHPDDLEREQAALAKMAKGEPFNEEYRIIRADGEIRWLYSRSSRIYDNDGHLLRHIGVTTDISDRKQMELELRSSEARFRSIFDQAALGIVQLNLEGQFVAVNQAFCDLIGYGQDELLELTWQSISHPDDTPICANTVERIVAGEIPSAVLEKRCVHKQGHYIWAKIIISYIHNEDCAPIYVLGLVEDITEYKQAAHDLAQTQNRYQNLVDGVHAIMYQYSTTQGGLFYSSRLKDILGYDVDYWVRNTERWRELIHPDDLPRILPIFSGVTLEQQYVIEYRIQDVQGNWHWFSDKSFNIEQVDDNEYIVSGLALDITQQKQTDEALRRRLKLETVLAKISNLIIVNNDLDFSMILGLLGTTLDACWMSIVYCQPKTTKLQRLGYWSQPAKEYIGEAWSTIEISHFPYWLEKWQTQEKILISDVQNIPEGGRLEREALIRLGIHALVLVPIQDDQGNPWGYLACFSDQAQPPSWSPEDMDVLAIAGDLIYHHLMRQQTRKNLEQAKEKAESANFAKSQFLTNMSHELRTPLNAILGFAQVMDQSPIFPEQHRQHLDIVAASGQKLLVFLNDIIELARFEEGQASLNLGLFNLHGLLDDLKKRFHSSGEGKNLDIEIHRSDDLPCYITADQVKLHSVLSHLLSNATKFTHQGQVRLVVEVTSHTPLRIRFSVIDTGIGIKLSEQSQLFQDFVQLEAGDRHGQGSGLGLALSQKFVRLMGGEITVVSQPNVGSCFSFELQWDRQSARSLGQTFRDLHQGSERTGSLTAADLQRFPLRWRQAFHKAACSARMKVLDSLIQEFAADYPAIAEQLQALVDTLDFETLANLSQPFESSESS